MVTKKFSKRITEGSLQCGSLRGTFSNGFTLVEMLVCIAIIGFLATTLLGSRDKYAEQLVLKNQAYKLVTYIRQAQVYSLGVKSDGTNFNVSYGVYITAPNNNPPYPNSFTFFLDKNLDRKYDATNDTNLGNITLSNGVVIDKICGKPNANGTGNDDCSTPQANFLSITFLRPSSTANAKLFNGGGQPINSVYPPIKIELKSPSGMLINVIVDSTGSISIQ